MTYSSRSDLSSCTEDCKCSLLQNAEYVWIFISCNWRSLKYLVICIWQNIERCIVAVQKLWFVAFNQMGYRVTPQFAQLVIFRYDPMAKQRLTLDNFIQACVLLKTVTDTFRQKDAQMKGQIQLSYEDFLTMVLLNKP